MQLKQISLNESWEINIDSDGVIADFEAIVSQHVGKPFKDIARGALWRAVEDYDNTVGPFFEALPKMPDADKLLDFVRSHFVNVKILTASGHVPKNGPQQKINWYKKHYGHDLVVKVVTKSPDKAQYAHPRAILIDDRSKSIDPWVAAGGIGILHTSADTTIAELKRITGLE
jgi:hypothetical protein